MPQSVSSRPVLRLLPRLLMMSGLILFIISLLMAGREQIRSRSGLDEVATLTQKYASLNQDALLADPFPQITAADKQQLLDYGYQLLDRAADPAAADVPLPAITEVSSNFSYNQLMVTVFIDQQEYVWQHLAAGNPAADVEATLQLALADPVFRQQLATSAPEEIRLVYAFLWNRRELPDKDLYKLEQEISPGLPTLEIQKDQHSQLLPAYFPVRRGNGLAEMINQLCRQIKEPGECHHQADVKLFAYDTLSFTGLPGQPVNDLYRFNVLVKPADLNSAFVLKRIESARDWYLITRNPETQQLEYLYDPLRDRYPNDNNYVRQLAVLWSMTTLDQFLATEQAKDYPRRQELQELIRRTLDHYLSFVVAENGRHYLVINNKAKLAFNAFMVMALLNSPDYPAADQYLKQLADGIVSQQQPDGSFRTYFISDNNGGVDFYPGEAMLALMKTYQKTGDSRYLDSVQNAFPYYRDYWRQHKNTAFIPWHSQADYLLYQETGDAAVAAFVMEMNQWLLDNRSPRQPFELDQAGGIAPNSPADTTYVRLEGLNDAFRLAIEIGDQKRAALFREAIRQGVRFTLQNQYTTQNAFYLPNPDRAIGGFRSSPFNAQMRIDYTQHALAALTKAYHNQIFE